MKLAVQLLKTYLGIKSSELLPSQTVLVPIAAYLYRKGVDSLNQVDEIDKRKIINWFFLASFNGYYSSQTDTKLDRDLEVIEKSFVFPWDDLIANMESRKARTRISFKDLERGLSVNALRRQGRAHLFLLYTLLIRNEADDWTGSLLRETSIDKVARHHIFPREFLQGNLDLEEPETSEVYMTNLANITFVHKDINSEIGDTPPSEYMPHYAASAEKHFIPTDKNLWGINQYGTFLEYRIKQIFAEGQKNFGDIFE